MFRRLSPNEIDDRREVLLRKFREVFSDQDPSNLREALIANSRLIAYHQAGEEWFFKLVGRLPVILAFISFLSALLVVVAPVQTAIHALGVLEVVAWYFLD